MTTSLDGHTPWCDRLDHPEGNPYCISATTVHSDMHSWVADGPTGVRVHLDAHPALTLTATTLGAWITHLQVLHQLIR